jgi:hypothetical protein
MVVYLVDGMMWRGGMMDKGLTGYYLRENKIAILFYSITCIDNTHVVF